jgi:hypothetical protein
MIPKREQESYRARFSEWSEDRSLTHNVNGYLSNPQDPGPIGLERSSDDGPAGCEAERNLAIGFLKAPCRGGVVLRLAAILIPGK